jgi:hypothetical protein
LLHDAHYLKTSNDYFDDTQGNNSALVLQWISTVSRVFLMTVSINRNYLTKDEIKNLSDSGHVIAAHTWDHHMANILESWNTQLVKPKKN